MTQLAPVQVPLPACGVAVISAPLLAGETTATTSYVEATNLA